MRNWIILTVWCIFSSGGCATVKDIARDAAVAAYHAGRDDLLAAAEKAGVTAAEKTADSLEAKGQELAKEAARAKDAIGDGENDASDTLRWLLLTTGVAATTTGAAELRKWVRDKQKPQA